MVTVSVYLFPRTRASSDSEDAPCLHPLLLTRDIVDELSTPPPPEPPIECRTHVRHRNNYAFHSNCLHLLSSFQINFHSFFCCAHVLRSPLATCSAVACGAIRLHQYLSVELFFCAVVLHCRSTSLNYCLLLITNECKVDLLCSRWFALEPTLSLSLLMRTAPEP